MNREENQKAVKMFQLESEPFIKKLANISAMKQPKVVKDINVNEVMFIEPEDSPEEREIKKAIELLRQKHFPNFTV